MADRVEGGRFAKGNQIGKLGAGVPRPDRRDFTRQVAFKVGEVSAEVIALLCAVKTREDAEEALSELSLYHKSAVNAILKKAEAGDLSALEMVNNRVAGKPKEHIINENALVDEDGQNKVFSYVIGDAEEDDSNDRELTAESS